MLYVAYDEKIPLGWWANKDFEKESHLMTMRETTENFSQ
jgi:hypothetical protein